MSINIYESVAAEEAAWLEWKSELTRVAQDEFDCPYGDDPCAVTGEACWRECFEEGDTPYDAMAGDMEYWSEP